MNIFLPIFLITLSFTIHTPSTINTSGLTVNQDATVNEFVNSSNVTLIAPLPVTEEYTPSLYFYCTTSKTGIDSIYNVQLVRASSETAKSFNGTIQVWLCDANTVEYVINGDFYNGGNVHCTVSPKDDIQLGETGVFSISMDSDPCPDHYQYLYDHRAVKYPK